MPLQGKRLKQLRQRDGLTQSEAAQQLEINIRQYQRYESGGNDPSADILGKLAALFQTSADYLIGLTDDPLPRVDESELTHLERLLIDAYRRGDIRKIIAAAHDLPDNKRE